MAQLIVLLLLITAGKLLLDNYNRHNTIKNVKKKKTPTGKVIDISNAWIDRKNMPYRKREFLLSAKELALYQTLRNILSESNYLAFPKIRLADLLILNPDANNYQEHRARVNELYADVVILEFPEMKPVLVILNDSETESRKKQLSDRFVRNAVETAGLPCLGIDAGKLPDYEEFRQLLISNGVKLKNRGYVNE